jgi:hypothetical protein
MKTNVNVLIEHALLAQLKELIIKNIVEKRDMIRYKIQSSFLFFFLNCHTSFFSILPLFVFQI